MIVEEHPKSALAWIPQRRTGNEDQERYGEEQLRKRDNPLVSGVNMMQKMLEGQKCT